MEPIVISASGVSKRYQLSQGVPWFSFRQIKKLLRKNTESIEATDEFWALKDISFQVNKGQRVGIIGRNGAGKSTLLKILSRLVYPTEGEIIIHGRVTSLLEVGTGFNMNLSGRDNIYLNASLHGLEKQEIIAIFDEIVDFSGVGDFLDVPVKNYSSGMYMRLAFSIAAHLDPDILILDEVLAVGDMAFQQKCLQRVERLASSGRTIIFVSHSMGDIARFCDTVIFLEKGVIKYLGNAIDGINQYEVEMAPKAVAELNSRDDRNGSGIIRLNRLKIIDSNLKQCDFIKTGQKVGFVLEYELSNSFVASAFDLNVTIVIEDEKRQRILGLPSTVLDVDLTKLKNKGEFLCWMEKCPLIPGIYFITLSILLNRQLADKITDAAKVIVKDGDYYGTGKLPSKNFGSICTDYTWCIS